MQNREVDNTEKRYILIGCWNLQSTVVTRISGIIFYLLPFDRPPYCGILLFEPLGFGLYHFFNYYKIDEEVPRFARLKLNYSHIGECPFSIIN